MALVKCTECGARVSSKAYSCPNCGIQFREPERSEFGKLIKFLFIAFNGGMAFWVYRFFTYVDESSVDGGATAATAIVVWFAFGPIWFVGFIVLGLLVLITRPR